MKVDRNPITSGHRGVKHTLSFCDPTSLVFPITRELQSTVNLYMVCCRCFREYTRGVFLLFSKLWICSSAQRAWYWYYRVRAFFCLFFTSHSPLRSSFEPNPYHAREITCLSSNLLTATFFFIYDKCKLRRHTVPTALPHSTRSVTDMTNPL